MIAERTKAGLESAKKRGKQLGRPTRLTKEQVRHAVEMISSGEETVSGMEELYGIDRSTLYRAMK